MALGGYDGKNYNDSTALIITILINNKAKAEDNEKALKWEERFVNHMMEYENNLTKSSNMKISYFSERSVNDELERQSLSDVTTIAISYIMMFLYVSSSLGQFMCNNKLFVNSKIGLAIVGVLIVLASVS